MATTAAAQAKMTTVRAAKASKAPKVCRRRAHQLRSKPTAVQPRGIGIPVAPVCGARGSAATPGGGTRARTRQSVFGRRLSRASSGRQHLSVARACMLIGVRQPVQASKAPKQARVTTAASGAADKKGKGKGNKKGKKGHQQASRRHYSRLPVLPRAHANKPIAVAPSTGLHPTGPGAGVPPRLGPVHRPSLWRWPPALTDTLGAACAHAYASALQPALCRVATSRTRKPARARARR